MYIDVIGYSVLLHSQKWLNESYYYIKREGPGNVVWNHWVNVWVPRERKVDPELLDSAIMLIDGSSNSGKPPSLDDTFVKIGRVLSSITGLMYINIKQIPNESLGTLADLHNNELITTLLHK